MSASVALDYAIKVAADIYSYYEADQAKQAEQEFRQKVLDDLAAISQQLSDMQKTLITMMEYLETQIDKLPVRLYHDQVCGYLAAVHDNFDRLKTDRELREQTIFTGSTLREGIISAAASSNPRLDYSIAADVAYLQLAIAQLYNFDPGDRSNDRRTTFAAYEKFFLYVSGDAPGGFSPPLHRLSTLMEQAQALLRAEPIGKFIIAGVWGNNSAFGWTAWEQVQRTQDGWYRVDLFEGVEGGDLTYSSTAGQNLTDEQFWAYLNNRNPLPNPVAEYRRNNPNNKWSEQVARAHIDAHATDLNTNVAIIRRINFEESRLMSLRSLTYSAINFSERLAGA